jgi:hypothetical protein
LLLLVLPAEKYRILFIYSYYKTGMVTPVYYLGQLLYSFYLFFLGMNVLPWKWHITLPALLFFSYLSIYSLIKLRLNKENALFICLWIFLPILIVSSNNKLFLARQIIVALPAYCLLLAWGINQIITIFFSAYGILNYCSNRQYLWPSYHEPNKEVADFITSDFNSKSDIIIISNANPSGRVISMDPLVYYFTLNKSADNISQNKDIYFLFDRFMENNRFAAESLPGEYDWLKKGNKRIWYVKVKPALYDRLTLKEIGAVLTTFDLWLKGNCRLLKEARISKDEDAPEKRKYIKGFFFPDYRAEVYLYSIT